jgi:hypothetical protein
MINNQRLSCPLAGQFMHSDPQILPKHQKTRNEIYKNKSRQFKYFSAAKFSNAKINATLLSN